jgi:hypothetical protein
MGWIWNAAIWFVIGAAAYFVFAIIRELFRRAKEN